MDKVIISSLSADDFERLSLIAAYLLSLKAKKRTCSVSCASNSEFSDYFVSTEPFFFTVEELRLLKKLKHLHILSHD